MRLPTILLPALLVASCGGGAGDDERDARRLADYAAEVGAAPVAAPEIPAGAPTVAFLGDSIAAGLHLPAERAFPAVLQRTLAAEGLPFHLVNAGVSGDTSAGGLSRIDWVLRSEPDVVVIELGGNDGLRGIELDSTDANLRAIVARVREAGARPLLLGMRMQPNLGEYAADFDALYPRLAEELDVPFVDFFMEGVGGVPEMNLEDQLHPTVQGHERLARNVASALRAVLESETAD